MWILALGGVVVPARGQAESEAPPSRQSGASVVRWRDLVRLVEHHPRVAGARFDEQAARAGVDAAGAAPNPTLEGTIGRGAERGGNASRLEWGLSLTIPLDWIARRSARVRTARADVQAVAASSKALRQDVLLQLGVLFWRVAYEQARLEALQHIAGQTHALARAVHARVRQGEVSPIEGTRVDVEVERLAMELETVQTQLAAKRRQLGLWFNLPDTRGLVVDASIEALPPTVPLREARVRARTFHPQVLAGIAQLRALESAVGEARSERVPSFSVAGFTDHELDRRAYGAGLSVDLPLWNWNTGAVQRAESRLAAERLRAQAAVRDVESDVIERQAECQVALQVAARYQRRVLPASEQAARMVFRTYELGEAPLLDVIDARRTVLETRSRYLEALATAHIQCGLLRILVGDLPS
ncbi:MAG: TolC family protein [Polyangiaceae bacterium]|nr:TolC family protein [Polyangiaceae bacterium]